MVRTVTDFPREVVETPDLGIVLADGCRLSARVWMPVDALEKPVPAVMEYIPYRKRDMTLPRDELMHPYFAGHGYAAVRVDMRGCGDSEGLMEDEYTEQELSDACEVIAWLAAQPWCSGTVGMMGKSWGGFNCLQTAMRRPPALKAVVTVCSTVDRFADDIHYKGGCLLGENFGWTAQMMSYASRPPDPMLAGNSWRDIWLQRLEAQPFLAERWFSHQARDDYWKHGSLCEDYGSITAAVLSFGGWADNYMNTVSHLVENLTAPVKGIVGPWVHQYPHTALPGPAIGFLQEALRWWDRWLKDVPNGAEDDPAYRAYMLHSAPPDANSAFRPGHWVAEKDWPTARVSRREIALSSGGVLGGQGGALSVAVSTPQHLGLHAGEYFPMGGNGEMPGDQAPEDALSVCFDTAPLGAPLDLLGAATLTLRLRSDKPRAFVVARLCDVAPDGSSVRISHGMLNLCHRDSREWPTDMPLGQEVEVTLTLDQMGYRLAEGHRLRLALSTTYWPFVWPSAEAATLTLAGGTLDLPIHQGGTGNEWTFPEPEAARGWNHRVIRPEAYVRRVEHDIITGRRTLVMEADAGDSENLDHGWTFGDTVRERWGIDPGDPLSACLEIEWEQRLARDDWSARTQVSARMTAGRDVFHLRATLRALEGSEEVFSREFARDIPRVHV
ncbi:CocE/NonD family hydrolase [Albidovulum sediminicola]|uniref:CocE/NonD family hydrolase n=1 Tax=Albidovulum sediminicola TaxID=2984331 RepID=A0ABT2YZL3_9RHOB|nr:CocE/NonD family hydrolase [Defluviimonas sp. WL0075]MCV2864328.1 CocE/NonD family hydrolase [Defluviimonas sp. WL0075]